MLIKTIGQAAADTKLRKVLVVGGVASNMIIREGLKTLLEPEVYFGSAELSSDNAVGVAVLAAMAAEG